MATSCTKLQQEKRKEHADVFLCHCGRGQTEPKLLNSLLQCFRKVINTCACTEEEHVLFSSVLSQEGHKSAELLITFNNLQKDDVITTCLHDLCHILQFNIQSYFQFVFSKQP